MIDYSKLQIEIIKNLCRGIDIKTNFVIQITEYY